MGTIQSNKSYFLIKKNFMNRIDLFELQETARLKGFKSNLDLYWLSDEDSEIFYLTEMQTWLRNNNKSIDIEIKNQYARAEGKWYFPTIFSKHGRNSFSTPQQCSYNRALALGIKESLNLL